MNFLAIAKTPCHIAATICLLLKWNFLKRKRALSLANKKQKLFTQAEKKYICFVLQSL